MDAKVLGEPQLRREADRHVIGDPLVQFPEKQPGAHRKFGVSHGLDEERWLRKFGHIRNSTPQRTSSWTERIDAPAFYGV